MKRSISIIIPNYNGRSLLEKNLPAVLAACNKWGKNSWEIIVGDDASTDDSVEFLKNNYPQIKVVTHQKNQRFAANCNSGVNAAQGKVIVLLNNDVSPEPNFLEPLLKHFEDLQVFAVGCKEKDFKNGQIFYSGRSEAKFAKGFLIHKRAEDQNKSDTFWAAGGSMAADREKWQKLKGMDVLFRPAYWEDIDLSYRAKKMGWKVLFEPNSIVNHQHETTNLSVFGKEQMKKFAYKNQFLFIWKNADQKLLLQHLVWLPYHLAKATLAADWQFWQGFFLALTQLPEVIKSRQRIKKYFTKKDSQLI